MKKILFATLITAVLMLAACTSNAQAWDKSTKIISLGFGASQFYHMDNYYYNDSWNYRNHYSPVTIQLNVQGEFGIHKYLGIGFTTGFGGRGGLRNDYSGEINIPIGMIFNFHFYQLIADKTAKNIHADKLDIYAGISAGSGLAVAYYTYSTRVIPMAFGGAHIGIRYFVAPKFALNLEAGMGKSIVNAGFGFKL